jgi:hypothetical protein
MLVLHQHHEQAEAALVNTIRSVLDRTSRGPLLAVVVVVFLVLLYLISFAPDVPFSDAYIRRVSGGHGVLDLMFGYGPAAGAAALDALGPQGRSAYNGFQLVDLAFPASYAIGLGSLILALFRRPWPARAYALALVPVVTAAFDYAENVGVFIALRTYPDTSTAALLLASGAGVVKMVGSYGAQALVLAGVVVRLVFTVRRRRVA